MFILTLSVLYFSPFGKNIMKCDFFLFRESLLYGTKLLFFAILHLSLIPYGEPLKTARPSYRCVRKAAHSGFAQIMLFRPPDGSTA